MLNLGNVEESTPSNAPSVSGSSNSGYQQQHSAPPPSYGSAPPPSYNSAPSSANPALSMNAAAGGPPSYNSNRPPPSYNGGGGGGGGGGMMGGRGAYNGGGGGGPRRGGGGGGWNGTNSMDEGSGDNVKYKTKICANFLNGQCTWGNSCAFAHGDYDVRLQSPNTNNNNAPSFGSINANAVNGPSSVGQQGPPPSNASNNNSNQPPPPGYGSQPPPYHGSPIKPPMNQRTPPPIFGANQNNNHFGNNPYAAGSPISPRSPIKLSSPTGGGPQRFRHEPYCAQLGKAFSSDNLQGLGSGHQSPRDGSHSVHPLPPQPQQ